MLGQVVDKVREIQGLDGIVVATPQTTDNRPIWDFCRREHVDYAQGQNTDVLGRFFAVATKYKATTIMRITADCPLLDPGVSSLVLQLYHEQTGSIEYVSNVDPPTFPDGLDTEVLSMGLLEWLHGAVQDPHLREHVTLYIRQSKVPFGKLNVTHAPNLSQLRWTVDTQEDLQTMQAMYPTLERFRHTL